MPAPLERRHGRVDPSASHRHTDTNPMTTVLIVDDLPALADQYAYDLRRIAGYETLTAFDGDAAPNQSRPETPPPS